MSARKAVKSRIFKRRDRREPILCYFCGNALTRKTATVDHLLPIARGGTNHMDNIVIACRLCNARKGPLTAGEFIGLSGDPAALKQAVRDTHARLQAERASSQAN